MHVNATVSKSAAEQGMTNHTKYISKTQGAYLLWPRHVVQRMDKSLEVVGPTSKVADVLAKHLSGPLGIYVSDCG